MKNKRQEEILRILVEKRQLNVKELSLYFQVSTETIRRDFEELEQKRIIRRSHGKAVMNVPSGLEPDYSFREIENYETKLLIGRRAAEYVNDGDVLMIDIGTTTLEFARFLHGKHKLTVMTNSLRIAYELMHDKEITVILAGGKVRNGEGTTSGHWAESMMDTICVDKYFLGVGAWDLECGITDYHDEETNLRRHCIQHAKEIIALSDSSKIGHRAMNIVCETKEINVFVTDQRCDRSFIKELRELGISVVIV